jgi:hypothetical protein
MDYAIQDFDNRTLSVRYETTDRGKATEMFERFKNGSCDLYVDVDGRTYRIICEQEKVESQAP